MTYLADESSADSSHPTEFFTISVNDGIDVWRHATGSRSITYGGNVYTAIATTRNEIAVTLPGVSETALELVLPITHDFVRRFVQGGIPPRRTLVTVYRRQAVSDETRTIWVGPITGMSCERSTVRFRVPSRAGQWMMRTVQYTVGQNCPWVLYGRQCKVSRDGANPFLLAHKRITTPSAIDGRRVTVDLDDTNRKGTWAEGGEFLHVATGERRTVLKQTDLDVYTGAIARLTLDAAIPGMKIGDVVHVFAGCDHTINGDHGCSPKFANRQHYGGQPHLPTKNVFIPGSAGVLQVP